MAQFPVDDQLVNNAVLNSTSASSWMANKAAGANPTVVAYIRVGAITGSPSFVFQIDESLDGVNVSNSLAGAAVAAANTKQKIVLTAAFSSQVRVSWVLTGVTSFAGCFIDLVYSAEQ